MWGRMVGEMEEKKRKNVLILNISNRRNINMNQSIPYHCIFSMDALKNNPYTYTQGSHYAGRARPALTKTDQQ